MPKQASVQLLHGQIRLDIIKAGLLENVWKVLDKSVLIKRNSPLCIESNCLLRAELGAVKREILGESTITNICEKIQKKQSGCYLYNLLLYLHNQILNFVSAKMQEGQQSSGGILKGMHNLVFQLKFRPQKLKHQIQPQWCHTNICCYLCIQTGFCRLSSTQSVLRTVAERDRAIYTFYPFYTIQYLLQCTLYIVQGSIHFKPYSEVHCVVYSEGYSIRCTLYSVHWSAHWSIHYTVYIEVYTIQCTLKCALNCTLYSKNCSLPYTVCSAV